jgi:hypothetical protein
VTYNIRVRVIMAVTVVVTATVAVTITVQSCQKVDTINKTYEEMTWGRDVRGVKSLPT